LLPFLLLLQTDGVGAQTDEPFSVLGLTSDDQNLHGERIKLWDDFNHAWLAMFQRQKEMMESGQQPQRPQSLVPPEALRKMGKELVKHCDSIERHGLVDYQFGVWEERIIESRFLPRLDLSCALMLTRWWQFWRNAWISMRTPTHPVVAVRGALVTAVANARGGTQWDCNRQSFFLACTASQLLT
jgi:hypothetical protein